MITGLWNLFFLILTIGILVTVHEWGHFWVARRLGVKVEVFSIGFGRALWKRIGRDGVEYRIAWIPLGGYVRMLDERESETPIADPTGAFNRQSVWVRTAVIIAGPLANFLFAVLAFAIMYWVGIQDLRAVLGPVPAGSPAAEAGLQPGMEITAVDGESVSGWQHLNMALVRHIGDDEPLTITAKTDDGEQRFRLPPFGLDLEGHDADLLRQLGLNVKRLEIPARIAVVAEQSPAEKAGLQIGDLITSVDSEPVDWFGLVEKIQAKPDETVTLAVRRNDQTMELNLVVGHQTEGSRRQGYLGISPQPVMPDPNDRVRMQLPFWDGFVAGIDRTIDTTSLIVDGLVKLVTGAISVKTLSGPVSIAQGAGTTAAVGVGQFFWFLGLISVNLGLINLLPIPVLDGGHLMYNVVEILRGKPLSERVQEWGLRIGMSLVGALMLIALFNDFARL